MSDPATVAPPGTRLTPKERAALRARDRSETDAEAAAMLGISVYTLREQLRNARSRLGVHSTHQAIRRARSEQAA